jgi:hypothetical protein
VRPFGSVAGDVSRADMGAASFSYNGIKLNSTRTFPLVRRRQRDAERGAAARRALGPDAAAMGLDDRPADRHKGNPTLEMLLTVLGALGLRLEIVAAGPEAPAARPRETAEA